MEIPVTMTAVRLHGPRDMRVEQLPHPGRPGPGQALLRVTATTICGSDLHSYKDARVGDNVMESPLILGHEFAAVVEAVGEGAVGGEFQPLTDGTRVAVDPAQPCWACEMCEQGNPNFCLNLRFCGAYPDDGSLAEWMLMPARSCFPVPDSIDDVTAAMLEPLGIAIHTLSLAKIGIGDSVAILGAGPIGLCILELVKLTGARPVFISDQFTWRLEMAQAPGVIPININEAEPVEAVLTATAGRGVDVAIEAAWADQSVQQAAAMARLGGRLVIVGISEDDQLLLHHSTARRKGLTIRMARRMKHTYPRAIQLVEQGQVDLSRIVTHRVPLAQVPEAFAMNLAYKDKVIKVVVEYG